MLNKLMTVRPKTVEVELSVLLVEAVNALVKRAGASSVVIRTDGTATVVTPIERFLVTPTSDGRSVVATGESAQTGVFTRYGTYHSGAAGWTFGDGRL